MHVHVQVIALTHGPWLLDQAVHLVCNSACMMRKLSEAECAGVSLQAYIDGLPIFTEMAYGWSNSDVGVMLGVLGLAAPLVNFTVGRVSAKLPDRHITVRTTVEFQFKHGVFKIL